VLGVNGALHCTVFPSWAVVVSAAVCLEVTCRALCVCITAGSCCSVMFLHLTLIAVSCRVVECEIFLLSACFKN